MRRNATRRSGRPGRTDGRETAFDSPFRDMSHGAAMRTPASNPRTTRDLIRARDDQRVAKAQLEALVGRDL